MHGNIGSGPHVWRIDRVAPALLTVLALLSMPAVLAAHYRPMIETAAPAPPALAEPGADAVLLRVRLFDRETGETTSATVSINGGTVEPAVNPLTKFGLRYSGNRHKGPIRFRELEHYFYTDGAFEALVPPGEVTIEAGKGYEYRPARYELHARERDTLSVEIGLGRWTDTAARGWYSGDTHIHMDRTGANDDTLLTVTAAKDIRYAYLLSMNTGGYDMGRRYESWDQAKGLGDRSTARRGGYFISSGQEYRVGTLGHVTIIMNDEYVPARGTTGDVNNGPSLAVIGEQARGLGGFIGLAHGGYHNQEADGLLLGDSMDFLELLQFGGYRSLGLDGWYDFLNIGFRLPIVGACDFPYTRELGSEITYVWSDGLPTPRSWAEAAAAGRSFATSGPLLFMEVECRKPGEIIVLGAENADTVLDVRLELRSELYPVRYVELIVNGWVAEREYFEQPRSSFEMSTGVTIRESSWIAARAYAGAGTDAHTNPVYVYLGDELPLNRDSARNILARLDGSIASIPNREVVGRLERLREELVGLMEGEKHGLPLPDIPE